MRKPAPSSVTIEGGGESFTFDPFASASEISDDGYLRVYAAAQRAANEAAANDRATTSRR